MYSSLQCSLVITLEAKEVSTKSAPLQKQNKSRHVRSAIIDASGKKNILEYLTQMEMSYLTYFSQTVSQISQCDFGQV